ncbi:hypothetical protein ACQPU1_08430 [Clostridium paraputrificum]|uniref:hypothetical protein n=1 Tax=Clostridium TaxID=1485 RepID=UPI003D34C767
MSNKERGIFFRNAIICIIFIIIGVLLDRVIYNNISLTILQSGSKIISILSIIFAIGLLIEFLIKIYKKNTIKEILTNKFKKVSFFTISFLLFNLYYSVNESNFIATYTQNKFGINNEQFILLINLAIFFIIYQIAYFTIFSDYYIKKINKDGFEISKEEMVDECINAFDKVKEDSLSINKKYRDIINNFAASLPELQKFIFELDKNGNISDMVTYDDIVAYVDKCITIYIYSLPNIKHLTLRKDEFETSIRYYYSLDEEEMYYITKNIKDIECESEYYDKGRIYMNIYIPTIDDRLYIVLDTGEEESIYPFELAKLIRILVDYFEKNFLLIYLNNLSKMD